MKFKIVTKSKKILECEAEQVILPGVQEEFSVWDFHQSFIYRLHQGHIRIMSREKSSKLTVKTVLIRDGLAKMKSNSLTILAQV